MTSDDGDESVHRSQLEELRRRLGAQLATCRVAAGLSQSELVQALGRTRSMLSKVEHGTRAMPTRLWKIADEVCGAQGALMAEYNVLAAAEQDYRERSRAQRRAVQRAAAHAQASSLLALPGKEVGTKTEIALISGGLAEELQQVITRLVRRYGRRDAIRLLGSVLTAAGLPAFLDPDEFTRLAQAVEVPQRVDARTVNNLAAMLTYCKRQEDSLGPSAVLDTMMAQHRIVRRLLAGDCPDHLRRSLGLVDSNMACSIGTCLVSMGGADKARDYFVQARRAAHDAGNPVYAAYAAANTSFVAFERTDTPIALDGAAAARSLAARTGDPRLKALAEQTAANAYALDGQYGLCMAAWDRAHDFLTHANASTTDSPAYWVHHGSIEGQRGRCLSRLGRPLEALDAATTALAQYDPAYVGRYTLCQVRLGYALALSQDITEAARVLGDAAPQAHLYPRLTAELLAAWALIQPWAHTHAVTTLDARLHTYGLLPTRSE